MSGQGVIIESVTTLVLSMFQQGNPSASPGYNPSVCVSTGVFASTEIHCLGDCRQSTMCCNGFCGEAHC